MKRKSLIQTIDRAVEILDILRSSTEPMRSKDIAEKMGLEQRTAHNLIRSLYIHDFLAQDKENRYLLGPACLSLAGGARRQFERLGMAVREPVCKLCEKTRNTVFFGTEYYGALYCVARAYIDGFWEVNGQQKWLNTIHATATGKVIIAEKGIDWFANLLKREELEKFTDRTINTVDAMAVEIEKIRKQQYALCINENNTESASLAVPVRNSEGTLIGSLAESFPDYLLESSRFNIPEHLELLRAASRQILENLH